MQKIRRRFCAPACFCHAEVRDTKNSNRASFSQQLDHHLALLWLVLLPLLCWMVHSCTIIAQGEPVFAL